MQDIERVKSNISKMIEMEAPEADIDQYLSEEGLKLEDLKKPQQTPTGRGFAGDKLDAVVRGVADAATFGFSDEIGAAFNAAVPIEKLYRPETASMWDEGFSKAYDKNLGIQRGIDKHDDQENFGYRLAGQLPAAVATGAITGGASIGARGLATAAAEGAAYGFGSGEEGIGNRVQGAGLGAAGGAVGFGIGRGVSKALNPSVDKGVRQLLDDGVPLTPGQIVGGTAKTVEDKLTSVPFVGDAIQSSRARGIEGFNKAAVNKSLKEIGKELPENVKAGYDAIEYAQDALSKAYNDLLPDLNVKLDKTFRDEFKNLRSLVKDSLPADKNKQFQNIINRQLVDRLSKNGSMTGESMKKAESELGKLIRNYGKSMDGDQVLLADALREAQRQLRGMVERSNPSKASQLKSINSAFAKLLRPESAASKSKDGIFTPAQLQTATRILDSSGRKKASSRGGALMQDFAKTGRDILPSSIPDSGTAGRALLAGGSAYASTSDSDTLQAMGMLGLLGSGAYTKTGQKAIQKILTDRPDLVSKMGGYFPQKLGLAGGVLATNP